jgi:hypothetical protein
MTKTLNAILTCSVDGSSGLLKITNFSGTDILGGTVIALQVSDFRNPISTTAVTNLKVFTTDDEGFEIDVFETAEILADEPSIL